MRECRRVGESEALLIGPECRIRGGVCLMVDNKILATACNIYGLPSATFYRFSVVLAAIKPRRPAYMPGLATYALPGVSRSIAP